MRTFIALELPEAFEDEVADLARQLSGLVSGRFMKRETYHLTLAFLGEIGEAESREVIAALDEVAYTCDTVALRPTGLGTFGKPRDCALWLGLTQTDELMTLADELRTQLDKHGIAYDRKAFRPHITLARRAVLPKAPLEGLVFPAADTACRLTLFKSTLSQEGASYKPLYSVELG